MKLLMLTFAALLTGCDAQPHSNVAAKPDELASINQRLGVLQARMFTHAIIHRTSRY